MSEERKMILNMLSEGKITVEEATRLLSAVGEDNDNKNESHSKHDDDHGAHPHNREPRFSEKDFSLDIDTDEIKKSIRDAKIASKEALHGVKESVREAIEESRKALSETLRNRKLSTNIDKIRSVDENLANEWEEAEQEFELAKKLHSKVQDLAEEITELNKYLDEIDGLKDGEELSEEDAKKQVEETIEKLKTLRVKKNDITKEAKERSEKAQNRILEVRRRCKDLGLSLENNYNLEDELSNQFQNMGEVISQATSQIGPMISKLIDGFSFSGFEGYEVKEEFTFTPENPAENIVLNANLQNGAIRVFGEEDRSNILVKVRKKIRASKDKVDEIAADLIDVKCAGNIVNVEVKKRFNNRHSAAVDMYVPKDFMYDCYLKSTNGRIKISDIQGKAWLLSTSNGRIVVEEGKVEKVKAASSNGSLRVDVDAKEMDLVTSNGSIRLYVPEHVDGNATLTTSNGSIKVFADDNVNASIQAKTSFGTIKVGDNWLISNSQKKTSKKTLSATTKNYNVNAPHLDIVAKTSNGTIKVLDDE